MAEKDAEENHLIKERLRKLNEIKESGIFPYPTKYARSNSAEQLHSKYGSILKAEEHTQDSAAVAGRIMALRVMGKVSFAALQDYTGRIQLFFRHDTLGEEKYRFLSKLDIGDILGAEGIVCKTKTGELTIEVKDFTLLSKSLRPLPEKFHGLKDPELRYRMRYLDLIMNSETKKSFEIRHKTIQAVREFLTGRGYIEVDTPILQPIYGGTNAKPFKSHLASLNIPVYMRVSNELYLKRLIVGGYEKIFEFSKDFRNEGVDRTHNPEFLQMETMCAYADYKDNMDFAEEMVEYVVKKVKGTTKISYQGTEIDFKRPWQRLSFVGAIKKYAKIDAEKLSDEELKDFTAKNKIDLKGEKGGFSRGRALEAIFEAFAEENLIQPTLIYDYPFETCGLAKPKQDDPRYAERFEPFVNGWELGNAYSELNDPKILENYWKNEEQKLKKGDEEAQRMDSDFIRALEFGMPPTSGIGLGVDRLIILLADVQSIRDIIFFPFMRPDEE